MIKEVVRTAGPTIKGMPSGTAPNVSGETFTFVSGAMISEREMTKRRIPPATIKSEMVIPKRWKITLPKRRKMRATDKEVKKDW